MGGRAVVACGALWLLAACGPASGQDEFTTPATPAAETRVTAQAVTFSYPASWFRTEWDEQGSFTWMIAAVSNHPLERPCTHYANGWTCGPPVEAMQPGTLLVMWWQNGFPGWTLGAQAGTESSVAGLPARVADPAALTTVCPKIGADSAMEVLIERPQARDNYFAFDACFKGPGVEAEKAQAMTILNSATFKT